MASLLRILGLIVVSIAVIAAGFAVVRLVLNYVSELLMLFGFDASTNAGLWVMLIVSLAILVMAGYGFRGALKKIV